MKKILFMIVALACAMSINAQKMKVMKNGQVIKTYKLFEADSFAFEMRPTTGRAMVTGDYHVDWVQLWKNGPKFAVCNLGDLTPYGYGGYYRWGSSTRLGIPGSQGDSGYNQGDAVLTGSGDTATNLWGSNWRMPTKDEFEKLLANCEVTWVNNYNGGPINGLLVRGKGFFADNSIFLPAGGWYWAGIESQFRGVGGGGFYWTSVPGYSSYAYSLRFYNSGSCAVQRQERYHALTIRPVLNE